MTREELTRLTNAHEPPKDTHSMRLALARIALLKARVEGYTYGR